MKKISFIEYIIQVCIYNTVFYINFLLKLKYKFESRNYTRKEEAKTRERELIISI